jgi:hypothetical protein
VLEFVLYSGIHQSFWADVVMNNLYRGPSIYASYQVSIHLAKRFQRFLEIDQPETIRERPFNFKGGGMFFSKKIFWLPMYLFTIQLGFLPYFSYHFTFQLNFFPYFPYQFTIQLIFLPYFPNLITIQLSNFKGGGMFFSKKIFWLPMLLKKIFWFWWREQKSDSEFLSYSLMLRFWKNMEG